MGKDEQGINVSPQRYRAIPRVLCFITHGDQILLLKGAPHKRIWANKYNGVGGHVERNEDVYSAAVREIREETGLAVNGLRLCGVVTIDAGSDTGIMLFIFTAQAASTQVTASGEGTLEWFPRNRLPANVVEDLTTLLPRVFSMQEGDAPFFAHYAYDDQDNLVITFASS